MCIAKGSCLKARRTSRVCQHAWCWCDLLHGYRRCSPAPGHSLSVQKEDWKDKLEAAQAKTRPAQAAYRLSFRSPFVQCSHVAS